jgi:hypothetical protein
VVSFGQFWGLAQLKTRHYQNLVDEAQKQAAGRVATLDPDICILFAAIYPSLATAASITEPRSFICSVSPTPNPSF